MRIAIILHPFGEKMPGGLPRVIFGWTRALLERDPQNEYVIFLKQKPKSQPNLPGKWKLEVLGPGVFWLDRLSRFSEADIYIFNTPVLPLFFKPRKSILIVYDFPYKYLPPRDFFDWLRRFFIGWYHRRSMKLASAIIAVSESAKQDIVKFFNIQESKIHVIYHGFERVCEAPQKQIALPDFFFFFAGTIKERKNVLNIVRAYEIFKNSDIGGKYKLVVCGKSEGKYYRNVKNYVDTNGLAGDVIFPGHLNDSELSYAYRRAAALVFPSIVEATGNPIQEAMDCGTPVITSNIFGPKELGGEAALLVDPYSVDDLAEAMKKIVSDPKLRNALIEKGFLQVKKFDWKDAAERTLKLISSL